MFSSCLQLLSPLSFPFPCQPLSFSRQNPPSLLPPAVHSAAAVAVDVSLSKPNSLSRSPESWIESLRWKVRSNLLREAISTYIDMIVSGVSPDNFAFPAVLKAVADLQDLNLGRQVHAHVFKFGYGLSSVTVANTLVNFYGKCGDLGGAYKVFDKISDRDQVSWNSYISSLCKFEQWDMALEAFRSMLDDNTEPSSFTLVSIALACSNLHQLEGGLKLGQQIHAYSLRTGNLNTFIINSLMAMYGKLGKLEHSEILLGMFEGRDLVTWNTMLSSFCQNEQFLEALKHLREMVQQGAKPDGFTIASVLPACSHLEMLSTGKEMHAYALKNGILTENSFVGSALVDMYCNCKQVESGRRVFDGIFDRKLGLWNAMITGYAQNDHDEEALMLFIEMEETSGLLANTTTMAGVVPACARSDAFSRKEDFHGFVIKRGLARDKFVQNALMDMYSRLGKTDTSEMIFDSMEDRDVVSWNTMITGYVISDHHEAALLLLRKMQNPEETEINVREKTSRTGLKPNSITLMTILPGCAALSALAKGKEIHAYAIKNMLATDIAVGSALVDMYAKCGCLDLSRKVFDQMPVRNVITWNVIIMAYGMHGNGREALDLFRKMVPEVKPNEITFISVFAACSHSGMVDEGLRIFRNMKKTRERIRGDGSKILPDWGYGRVYTAVVVNCTFPSVSAVNADNSGGSLLLHATTGDADRNVTDTIRVLSENPNAVDFELYDSTGGRRRPEYDYLYCGSSLYGNLSPQRVREWIAYHARLFGERSHFVLHDAGGVHEEVLEVLRPWMELGRVTLHDIRDQERFDGYYHNQFMVVNDCLHRYRFMTKWMFFFDVDEFIYVPPKNTIASVMESMDEYSQFTIEQMPMSSELCFSGDGPARTYRKWGFEKLAYRDVKKVPRMDRKYAVQPRNVFATGVHMSQNLQGRTYHKAEGKIRYFHYHGSISQRREPCRHLFNDTRIVFRGNPYVLDTTLRDVGLSVKTFELRTIGDRLLRTRQ
ncbi:PREDICTED: pentatricopeptide repeat-containing protein At3g57430, chloroplastic-like [Tarenaya hassleriana]|uniref:pentatricopeptide repeat-containing protein At3g57430, chloroplastic-like n=1 Tax=Tarenaya hassleriana TaxID=28532 RepID=UPI0008FD0406|nr:PREDICTED: pentatricopeptide repeat-containing protein At3g57430, chloroplastic-like [Tarenaya hassleriana]